MPRCQEQPLMDKLRILCAIGAAEGEIADID
jgi:hypothetical protein